MLLVPGLKAHYPQAYMAALMSSVMNTKDRVPQYVAEARAMKIQVLPPDVNESGRRFTVVGETIRFGLSAVKNVGDSCVEAIIAAHLVLIHDEAAKPQDRFSVKAHVAVPGPDVHAEESAETLHAAIDLVGDKLARQLRKRKTKLTDKRRSTVQRARERQASPCAHDATAASELPQ